MLSQCAQEKEEGGVAAVRATELFGEESGGEGLTRRREQPNRGMSYGIAAD